MFSSVIRPLPSDQKQRKPAETASKTSSSLKKRLASVPLEQQSEPLSAKREPRRRSAQLSVRKLSLMWCLAPAGMSVMSICANAKLMRLACVT